MLFVSALTLFDEMFADVGVVVDAWLVWLFIGCELLLLTRWFFSLFATVAGLLIDVEF